MPMALISGDRRGALRKRPVGDFFQRVAVGGGVDDRDYGRQQQHRKAAVDRSASVTPATMRAAKAPIM